MSAGLLSRVMREFGIQSSPADPRLIALAQQGVLADTVRAACEQAKRAKPNEAIPPAYVTTIIERWAAEAAALKASGAKAPARPGQAKQSRHSGFDQIDYRDGVGDDGSF
jgi:acyl-CoA reductase-like NAD-dependent aldehyde dehydrogenase